MPSARMPVVSLILSAASSAAAYSSPRAATNSRAVSAHRAASRFAGSGSSSSGADRGGHRGQLIGVERHRPGGSGDRGNGEHLAGHRLRGRDRELGTDAEREHRIDGPGQRAVRVVDDRHRARAAVLQTPADGDDLGRRARLADGHHKEARVVRPRVVERVQARRGEPGRATGRQLGQVAAVDGRVVRRPAREEHHAGERVPQHTAHGGHLVVEALDEPLQGVGLLGHLGAHALAAHAATSSSASAMAPRSGPSWTNSAGTSSGANGALTLSRRSSAARTASGWLISPPPTAMRAGSSGSPCWPPGRPGRRASRRAAARARGSGCSNTLGGGHRRRQAAGSRARRSPARRRTPRAARGPPPRRCGRAVAQAVADLAGRAVRAVQHLAVDDDRRRDAGAEDQQDRRVRAAQAAPAQLGDGRRLHVCADRRPRRREALAQKRRQLQLLPAGHVRRERDTVLEDDAGAHRRHRDAAAASRSQRQPPSSSSARTNARSTAWMAPRRGVGVEPVGFEQVAVQGRRGERRSSCRRSRCRARSRARGSDGVAIRHER